MRNNSPARLTVPIGVDGGCHAVELLLICQQRVSRLIDPLFFYADDFSGSGNDCLRTETERPEAVIAGTAEVIGVEEEGIYQAAHALLTDQEKFNRMATAVNPYGDGQACRRIVACIEEWAGLISE
jgi:hypothetical protein